MTPIRPENKDRYPKDWDEISKRVRERAGNRCEGTPEFPNCRAVNYKPHPETGSRVVLTVAHLISATRLPVDLHVARTTEANEIVELVGDLVRIPPEETELPKVVYDRTLSEFIAGPSATMTRFIVSLPSCAPSGSPRRAVVGLVPTAPIWVLLSRWSLDSKPSKPTLIATEAPTGSEVITRDAIPLSAPLADADAEPTPGLTDRLTATGFRADFGTIRRLLRREGESQSAHNAILRQFTPSRSGHAALYCIGSIVENCDEETNLRALCQRCHVCYDRRQHQQNRIRSRHEDANTEEMFDREKDPRFCWSCGAFYGRAFPTTCLDCGAHARKLWSPRAEV